MTRVDAATGVLVRLGEGLARLLVAFAVCSGALAATGCEDADLSATTSADMACSQLFCLDSDGDGHGDPKKTMAACAAPAGYVGACDDCNDTSGDAHPGATEICDGVDNDCDGKVDDITTGDGGTCSCTNGTQAACGTSVGTCKQGMTTCVGGQFGPCMGATDPTTEVFDGLDNDCNGTVDDSLPLGIAVRVRTAANGPRIIYYAALPGLPTKPIDTSALATFTEGGNDDASFNDGYLYRYNRDNQTFTRYRASVKGSEGGSYAAPALVADGQLSLGKYGFTGQQQEIFISSNLAFSSGFASANGKAPSIARWDPTALTLIDPPIDADLTRPNYGAGILNYGVIFGDHVVYQLYWTKTTMQSGLVAYPNLTLGFVRTDGSQDLMVVEDNTGKAAIGGSIRPFVDSAGDLYVAGNNGGGSVSFGHLSTDLVNLSPPRHDSVVRIKKGQTTFDPTYYVDLDELLGVCAIVDVYHVADHKLLVTGLPRARCDGATPTTYSNNKFSEYFVDLDTMTSTPAAGLPDALIMLRAEYHWNNQLIWFGYSLLQYTDMMGIFHDSLSELYSVGPDLAVKDIVAMNGDLWGLGAMTAR